MSEGADGDDNGYCTGRQLAAACVVEERASEREE